VPWLRIALFLAAVGAAYYLFVSSTFAVQQVEALGDAHLPLAQLEQECHCLGKNIFLLQPDSIRRRLATIPTLVVDDVYGRLPNRLVVEAHFKKPDMIWHSRDGYFLADAQGELFARAVGRSTLPVITVKKTDHLTIGRFVDAGAMLTVRGLIRYLPPSLRSLVSDFYYSDFSGVTIATKHKWLATFGWLTPPVLQERIIILQFMLQQSRAGNTPPFNYADLRFSSPYTRYDKAGPAAQWAP
jgi:hypothetical protein